MGAPPEPASEPGRDPFAPGAGTGSGGSSGPGAAGSPGWRPDVGPPPGQQGWTPSPHPGSPAGWSGGPPESGGPAGSGGLAESGGPSVPHCYRHPDRETYVTCQRCDRPICPDCMRPAAVGFQCPEEGRNRSSSGHTDGGAPSREPRTALGGRATHARQAVVTQCLIGICVVAYFLQGAPGISSGGDTSNSFTHRFAMIGYRIAIDDQYYRLLTAAFLHAGVLHILFNMYALFLLGFQLEALLGRARYLGLFVAGAVGGNTLSYLLGGLSTASVGASTAIFAFFAAYYVIARRLRIDSTQILVIIGINLAITFTFSSIDKWGHLGGLAVGALIGLLYAYVPPRYGWAQAGGVLGLVAALLLAAVVKSSALT
ncbi:putative membrane protein [Frankia sp. AiPs1]|uniref:rhomboid family intramembrane serine protease n=1 Tax=Frankia sp. AiPa1 TaxID=573492 RepID=UPI00202B4D5D|nr:rhomboid family intramembrane serine protease [Frankia sp. AiPa1]MCL9761173.1 rhomboid family intramembrane serine protease [Frankia sp. AiPa1]